MSFVTNKWIFIFGYGIGNGITIGNAYLLSLYISWTYFSNKTIPIVTGAILFFSGIASMILGPVTSYVVNPDRILDDKSESVYKRVP